MYANITVHIAVVFSSSRRVITEKEPTVTDANYMYKNIYFKIHALHDFVCTYSRFVMRKVTVIRIVIVAYSFMVVNSSTANNLLAMVTVNFSSNFVFPLFYCPQWLQVRVEEFFCTNNTNKTRQHTQ